MTGIFSANGWLNTFVSGINNILWTYILVAVLIACALLFTFKTRGVQFRMVGEMVRLLSVFTDTLLICSCTAFIILLSGVYTNHDLNGIQLTQNALFNEVGKAGPVFVALAIFMFAFSSIIGNYTYGEMNVKFLTKDRRWLFFVRVMNGIVMVMFGALASLDLVWSLGDFFMGCITLCNLYAIVRLHPQAVWLLKDYVSQKRDGIKSPEYHNEEQEAWK